MLLGHLLESARLVNYRVELMLVSRDRHLRNCEKKRKEKGKTRSTLLQTSSQLPHKTIIHFVMACYSRSCTPPKQFSPLNLFMNFYCLSESVLQPGYYLYTRHAALAFGCPSTCFLCFLPFDFMFLIKGGPTYSTLYSRSNIIGSNKYLLEIGWGK